MNLVDTHAHLYWDLYNDDLDQVIKRALEASVTTIINVGVDVQLSKKALEQVTEVLTKFSGLKVHSTIGIHPHESIKYSDVVSIHNDIDKLEELYLSAPDQIVAVGECGLDFVGVDDKQKKMQTILFKAQIDLAKKLNLPLIVHCRDDRAQNPETTEAWDQTLSMIENQKAVLHCYSGFDKTTQKALLSPNLLFSFAATITYPKNEYLRKTAKILPLEKFVLETDCPFLPPQSKRGQRNEPAAVLEIAQLIADLKGVSLEEVAAKTTANTSAIFNI